MLSVCACIGGDYKTAPMWIKKAGVVENPAYHLIAAAVLAAEVSPTVTNASLRRGSDAPAKSIGHSPTSLGADR